MFSAASKTRLVKNGLSLSKDFPGMVDGSPTDGPGGVVADADGVGDEVEDHEGHVERDEGAEVRDASLGKVPDERERRLPDV